MKKSNKEVYRHWIKQIFGGYCFFKFREEKNKSDIKNTFQINDVGGMKEDRIEEFIKRSKPSKIFRNQFKTEKEYIEFNRHTLKCGFVQTTNYETDLSNIRSIV